MKNDNLGGFRRARGMSNMALEICYADEQKHYKMAICTTLTTIYYNITCVRQRWQNESIISVVEI